MKRKCDITTLGSVATIYSGFAFRSKDLTSAGIPVVKIANIQNKRVKSVCPDHLPENLFEKRHERYILHDDDTLVAMTGAGSVGRVGKMPSIDGRYLVNQRVGIVRPDSSQADPTYIYYVLSQNHYEEELYGYGLGAGQPNVSAKQIGSLKIPCPDLPTQRRIAGILSAYDDLIENNLRRIQILEEMAQSLYREWFVHFRYPGHESVPLADSPLGPIPEGWEPSSIEDVCDRVTDGSHSSPASVEEGMPMASSKDMHTFGLNLESARTISGEDYEKLVRNGCQPKKDDILITKDGANYLKYIFVVENDLDVVLLSSIAILSPNSKVNPHFFAAVLNVAENKERLKNYVTGAAIPRIILKDFKRFQFVLPPVQIQQAWANIGESATKLCWDLVSKNQTLRETRDLLLPKLLSGDTNF